MKMVFLGAQIQAQFGVMDEEGNVTPQQPVGMTLHKLSDSAASDVVKVLIEQRNAAQAQLDAQPPAAPATAEE